MRPIRVKQPLEENYSDVIFFRKKVCYSMSGVTSITYNSDTSFTPTANTTLYGGAVFKTFGGFDYEIEDVKLTPI